jgi:poly-gamma-glutamate synthesis protein (capsule biosynthesis protein)
LDVTDHPIEYVAAPGRWSVALAQIASLREHCDLVIVFPHWGPNMTTHPARWQQRAAAELHSTGADLVAGHSVRLFHGGLERCSHAVDLGDALDDYMAHPDLRNDLGVLAIWRP